MEVLSYLGSIVIAALAGYAYGKSVGSDEGAEKAARELANLHRTYRLVPKAEALDSTY